MNIVDENFVPQDEMDEEFLKDMQEEQEPDFDEEEFGRILDELDKEQKEGEKDFGEKLDYFYEHTLAHPDTLEGRRIYRDATCMAYRICTCNSL